MLDNKSKDKLRKLHPQFGHLSEPRFRDLVATSGKWKDEYDSIVSDLYDKCKTCKLFAKAAPRPVLSLPAAAEFSEVLTMDLKECNYSAKHK